MLRLKVSNLRGSLQYLIRNIRILPELTSAQRGIVCLLGTVFEGEYPSINKIAKIAHMNFNTIKILKEMQVAGYR